MSCVIGSEELRSSIVGGLTNLSRTVLHDGNDMVVLDERDLVSSTLGAFIMVIAFEPATLSAFLFASTGIFRLRG
jgi:hypothetical protein